MSTVKVFQSKQRPIFWSDILCWKWAIPEKDQTGGVEDMESPGISKK